MGKNAVFDMLGKTIEAKDVEFGYRTDLQPSADAAQAGRRQAYGGMPDSNAERSADGFVKKTSIEAGNCVCYHEFNKSEVDGIAL